MTNVSLMFAHRVSNWAKQNNLVSRAWLLEDSGEGGALSRDDIEIAVELDLTPGEGTEVFSIHAEKWSAQLAKVTGKHIRLSHYNPPETVATVAAVRERGRLLYVYRAGLIYSVARTIVPNSHGEFVCSIEFGMRHMPDRCSGFVASLPLTPQVLVRLGLAGVIAEHELCADRFSSSLADFFRCDVEPDNKHPKWHKLRPTERHFWKKSFRDLEYPRSVALEIAGGDPEKAREYLRECEPEVRAQVWNWRKAIRAVARDIESWLLTAEPDEYGMLSYPAERVAEGVALQERLDARPVWQRLLRFYIVEGWKLGLRMWLKWRQQKHRRLNGRPGQAPLPPAR